MYLSVKKLLFFVLCLVCSSPLFAGGGQTGWGKIIEIYTHPSWTEVKIDGFSNNPDACGSTVWYSLPLEKNGNTAYNSMYTSLLTAFTTGKSVTFWVSGCGGQFSYPSISSIRVK